MRCPRLIATLCALVLSSLAASRSAVAASPWTALGPFGGTVSSLAVDPADARVVYATAGTEGVFKSADAGATWIEVLRGSIPGIVAVARGGVVYVSVSPGEVQKSTDGGAHWTLASQGLPDSFVRALAVDPVQPSRVFAAPAQGGIWRSTDGGASWQPANTGLSTPQRPVVASQIALARGGTVYVATSSGVYRSVDGGLSWRRLRGGLPLDTVLSVAVSPTDPRTVYASLLSYGVYRSTDGGATWRKTAGQVSIANALAVSPRSPRLVLAGTAHSGLFRSADGGEHWTAVGPASSRSVLALAVAPSALRFVYAGVESLGVLDPGGVLASEDGGLTWTRRNRGIAALDAPVFVASPGARGTLWIENSYGLFRSRNGGAGWQRSPLGNLAGVALGEIALPALAPSTAYVLTGAGLWQTTDGGDTWRKVPGTGGPVQYLWADPVDPDGLWGSSLGRLYQSRDGGAAWQEHPELGAVLAILWDLAFAPSSPSTVYVAGVRTDFPASYATVFRSTDGGTTWTRADSGLNAPGVKEIAVDPVDPRRVYAGTHGYFQPAADGVWVSTDGGDTWARAGEEMQGQSVAALAVSSIPGILWAATEAGRIFRSGNGGATWEDRTAGFPAAAVRKLAFDPFDPRKLYAATSGGLYVTVDGPLP